MSIDSIDLYCERLGSGVWDEPINAFTNLSFVIAAIITWTLADRRNALNLDSLLLISLMAAIGIGSGLFHTFANSLTRILDIIPILLFQIVFLWIYGRKIIKMATYYLAGIVGLFLVAAYIGRQFPGVLNGSLIYAPSLILLLGLGFVHLRIAQNEKMLLLWAVVVFVSSLVFRSIDLATCEYTYIGTHFMWHLLNGLLVYLVARGLLVNLTEAEHRE